MSRVFHGEARNVGQKKDIKRTQNGNDTMTTVTQDLNFRTPIPNVIGPYSEWPRKTPTSSIKRPAILAASAALAGVFIHCVVPMIA